MKKVFLAILVVVLLFSCRQNNTSNEKESVKQEIQKSVSDSKDNKKSELADPDPDDGVPPEQYSPHNSNIQTAARIRKFLTEDLLKDELKLMTEADRKFQYEEVDLNEDGKKEYLVGLENPYFCGTGGCTFYLLNNDGSVITVFSVSEAPFIAMFQKTNGWRDLLVKSNGAMRILKYNGKTYPSNPSMAPEFKQRPRDDAYRLLWDEYPIPTFKF